VTDIDRCENDRKAALSRFIRYNRSEAGRKRNEKYFATEKAKEKQKRYNRSHAAKVRDRKKRLKAFGLTTRQYDLMFALQDGKCVGCGRPPKTRRLAVEHDHKTGRVRGLACHRCNRQLIAQNTAETARWLVAYLSSDFDGRTL